VLRLGKFYEVLAEKELNALKEGRCGAVEPLRVPSRGGLAGSLSLRAAAMRRLGELLRCLEEERPITAHYGERRHGCLEGRGFGYVNPA
jgi:hypothetical protein